MGIFDNIGKAWGGVLNTAAEAGKKTGVQAASKKLITVSGQAGQKAYRATGINLANPSKKAAAIIGIKSARDAGVFFAGSGKYGAALAGGKTVAKAGAAMLSKKAATKAKIAAPKAETLSAKMFGKRTVATSKKGATVAAKAGIAKTVGKKYRIAPVSKKAATTAGKFGTKAKIIGAGAIATAGAVALSKKAATVNLKTAAKGGAILGGGYLGYKAISGAGGAIDSFFGTGDSSSGAGMDGGIGAGAGGSAGMDAGSTGGTWDSGGAGSTGGGGFWERLGGGMGAGAGQFGQEAGQSIIPVAGLAIGAVMVLAYLARKREGKKK